MMKTSHALQLELGPFVVRVTLSENELVDELESGYVYGVETFLEDCVLVEEVCAALEENAYEQDYHASFWARPSKGTYISLEVRKESDLWLVMQVFALVVSHHDDKETLLGDDQENLHACVAENPADVWGIHPFEQQATFFEVKPEVSEGEKVLFAFWAHPSQHLHWDYQFWEHLSLELQKLALGAVKVSVVEVM